MKKNEMAKRTTATNLLLRLFVGGFLIYLAYGILTGLGSAEGASRLFLITVSVFFIVCGGVIGVHSLYCLIRHRYYDPMQEAESTDQAGAEDDKKESEDELPDAAESENAAPDLGKNE